jgi:hypothetical protein
VRTPYNKNDLWSAAAPLYLERGFALVVQDIRGKYASEGDFDIAQDELRDVVDTLDWIVAQPWSTGAVGMIGWSYEGLLSWVGATSRHPALRAIVPIFSSLNGDEPPRRVLELGDELRWTAAMGCQRYPLAMGPIGFTRRPLLEIADLAAGQRIPALIPGRPSRASQPSRRCSHPKVAPSSR